MLDFENILDTCVVGGKKYKDGESFYIGCDECTCHGSEFCCYPVCPRYLRPIYCTPDKGRIIMVDVPAQRKRECSCKKPICE